jgi:hypothetical protein
MGGRRALVAGKARKRRRLAFKASVGAGLAADRWQGVADCGGSYRSGDAGRAGRLCRTPAAVLAARACARPLGRGAGGRPRSREIASCRWPYAPRERTDREAPYLGGACRASAVSRDGRPLRLKRRRAAHVAEDFQAEALGDPGNRAVHPPLIALLQLGGVAKLSARIEGRVGRCASILTCNL